MSIFPAGAVGHHPMRSVEFRREREAGWQELEDLIALADKDGLRSLSAGQLARLPHLYRATLSSLSVARSISLDQALVQYLESLVGRAYFVVYGTRQHVFSQVWEYLTWRWPAAIRRRWKPILVSVVIMSLGAVVAFLMTRENMDYYYTFIGEMAQGRTPASSTSELRAGLYDTGEGLKTFAAALFSHNAQIGILAAALGFVVGLPTAILLFFNGIVLGTFAALYASRGLSVDLWGWLLPHGVTELGAVMLCGGAGFTLAAAIAFPGLRPRLDNLRDHGKDAARIVIGCVIMLFVAGLIEGIFRQEVQTVWIRYTVAGGSLAWWVFFFGFVGRRREREEAARLAEREAAT
jgi:uncharacterized membrane protein SpoIIM required for sporulation